MTPDLLWPGDERAGALMSDAAVLAAMTAVEQAWLAALVALGVAPPSAAQDLAGLVGADDLGRVASGAEGGGNPVIGFVTLLRERGAGRDAARWLHRGLTSQDVLDTALLLAARDATDVIDAELRTQIATVAQLARRHRDVPMAGRTLTQHAVPITFGRKAAGWLLGLLDAAEDLTRTRRGLPGQFGGAAGTRSALVELASRAGLDGPAAADAVVAAACGELGLVPAPPWHTSRAPVTRIGDALVGCTDAWGHVAADVLTGSRPEIGELAEPTAAGRGGSSAMPHKTNPVLSVLLRRAALAAPPLGAQLHLAAVGAGDERPDGAWHVEWDALRTLARHAAAAAGQATELLTGLRVDTDRMRATLDAAADGLLAERASLDALRAPVTASSPDPASYLGACGEIVDAVVARADRYLTE